MAVRTSTIDGKLEQSGYEILTARSSGIVGGSHHHSGLEITLVHSGSMEFTRGEISKRLAGGDLALLDADAPHATRPLLNSYFRTALHFDPRRVPGNAGAGLLSRLDDHGGILFLSMNPEVGPRFLWACKELSRMSKEGLWSRSPSAEYLLGLIAADIEALSVEKSGLSSAPVLWEILSYMEHNLNSRERVSDLAKRFYLSTDNLQRIFRKHLGTSPYQYWLRLKLERACEALSTSAPVQEIADALGFESLSGFGRAFKREFGITPSEYREGLRARSAPGAPA